MDNRPDQEDVDARLLDAAADGHTDKVLQLLEEEGQILHSFKDKVRHKDLTRSLTRTQGFQTLPAFQNGNAALHVAAARGHVDTVTALTLNGADVNAQNYVSFHRRSQLGGGRR